MKIYFLVFLCIERESNGNIVKCKDMLIYLAFDA